MGCSWPARRHPGGGSSPEPGTGSFPERFNHIFLCGPVLLWRGPESAVGGFPFLANLSPLGGARWAPSGLRGRALARCQEDRGDVGPGSLSGGVPCCQPGDTPVGEVLRSWEQAAFPGDLTTSSSVLQRRSGAPPPGLGAGGPPPRGDPLGTPGTGTHPEAPSREHERRTIDSSTRRPSLSPGAVGPRGGLKRGPGNHSCRLRFPDCPRGIAKVRAAPHGRRRAG